MSDTLIFEEQFENRHHGSSVPDADTQAMLDSLGVATIEELIDQTLPASIRLKKPMNLPAARSEAVFLKEFAELAAQNQVLKSYIGMGYYGTHTPNVILRNVLENPCWYTAYTPYQAEIAQGRLEALINFQTMIMELTGMQIANASLLDEATAAAEAMAMLFSQRKDVKKKANVFLVSDKCHPQTIDVLYTRAEPIGIVIELISLKNVDLSLRGDVFALLYQYPDTEGTVSDFADLVSQAIAHQIFTVAAADLLALCLLVPPGQIGVDVVVGTSQRFGVPMGFGGPHAAYFATRDSFKRNLPGRLIGVSIDAQGNRAYRMALQTREQHIRREKATSNICTAQVLLAVIASCYAVYHGPKNLGLIANRVASLAQSLAQGIKQLGLKIESENFFDTIKINAPLADKLRPIAEQARANFRYFADQSVGIALDETTNLEDVNQILALLAHANGKNKILTNYISHNLPISLLRQDHYLSHPVFNSHHTEHAMLRYLKKLESKDLSLAHSMIALGSCTMKLNATAEMIPISWPGFANMHPFAPKNQAKGYYTLFENLEKWLAEITGFAAVTLQPNSGAQGEYAGLMVIRAYHQNRQDHQRDIALIPASAHGTNPASAVMAGMKVVVVNCDAEGNIDQTDLKVKALQHKENLACLMVTYPSTHGVFEDGIREICEMIHEYGGQVYMDGANMNAQVGLTSPGYIGADVCHLNLHKTFCIPHGGGGPGMGPIGVAAHLAPFLPSHSVVETGGSKAIRALSAAPYGSASILPISYAYIAMMGPDGLVRATQKAILNANYIKKQLEGAYPVLYAGANGRCAHELIIDFRSFKRSASIEVQDVAKRLMDYGFHAPTVSFPVAGTLMIEPTESETKAEIDRFCQALLAIRQEIAEIEQGLADAENNVLKNAPHTARLALSDDWALPYSRQKAVYPLDWVMEYKFWPSVGRIDSAYGDRNLMCACPAIETYAEVNA